MRIFLLSLMLVACAPMCAQAQQLTMQEALSNGKDTGRLPAWLSLDDGFTLKWANGRSYGCFTDRATGARQARWAPVETLQNYMVSGLWNFTPGVPTLYDDERVCFPDLPVTPPTVQPTAIGQPIYKAIVHQKASAPPYWRTTTPLNFTDMNRDFRAGTTTAGEPCGTPISETVTGQADTKIRWHNFRGPGGAGITLCR